MTLTVLNVLSVVQVKDEKDWLDQPTVGHSASITGQNCCPSVVTVLLNEITAT
jgi:hypothetical protein